jgi:hypothetical protein
MNLLWKKKDKEEEVLVVVESLDFFQIVAILLVEKTMANDYLLMEYELMAMVVVFLEV